MQRFSGKLSFPKEGKRTIGSLVGFRENTLDSSAKDFPSVPTPKQEKRQRSKVDNVSHLSWHKA